VAERPIRELKRCQAAGSGVTGAVAPTIALAKNNEIGQTPWPEELQNRGVKGVEFAKSSPGLDSVRKARKGPPAQRFIATDVL